MSAAIVPPGLNHVVSVEAGDGYSLAVKDDGSIVAWGSNLFGAPLDGPFFVSVSTGQSVAVGLAGN